MDHVCGLCFSQIRFKRACLKGEELFTMVPLICCLFFEKIMKKGLDFIENIW